MTALARNIPAADKAADRDTLPEHARQRGSVRLSSAEGKRPETHQFFMKRSGVLCAGAHLIIDLYGARNLDDRELVEKTLRRCVEVAGATLLHIHLHRFEPNGGLSGVAVLAESHISIHSWPEVGYAALDIFMCGKTKPERCVDVLVEAFQPRDVSIQELLRGRTG